MKQRFESILQVVRGDRVADGMGRDLVVVGMAILVGVSIALKSMMADSPRDSAIEIGSFALIDLLLLFVIVRSPRRERVRELERRASESRRLALNAQRTTNAVIVTDPNSCITWVNPAFVALSGYTLEEAVGKKPGALLQFERSDVATVAAMREAIAKQQPFRGEILNRGKDGREYWLDIDIQPQFDEDGRLTSFMAIETDITLQVTARSRLQSVFAAVAEGILVIDTAGRVVECNAAAERILGRVESELRSEQSLMKSWGAIDSDGTALAVDAQPPEITLRSGESIRSMVVGVGLPGRERRWLSMSSEPFTDIEGSITAAVVSFVDITLHREQEALLAEQRTEIDRFFNSSLELLCIVSTDGRFVRLNDEWTATLGYSCDELKDSAFLDHVHPEDRAATIEKLLVGEQPESVRNFENRFRSKRGEYRWIEWRVTVIGGLLYAAARDVTERRKAAAELKLFTERYTAAVSGTSDGLWDWRVGSDEVWFAERFWTLLGFPDSGPFPPHRGKSFRDRLHPDDFATAIEAMRSNSYEGAVYDVEFRLRREDGSYHWFRARGKTQRAADGRTVRMAGSIQDITERRNAQQLLEEAILSAEAALREVNALRSALDEHSLISIADRRGKIIAANSGFSKISGYSNEELIGQDHKILNSGVHSREFWTEVWRTIASGVAWRGEVCNRRKDGSLYWVDSTIVPYLDAEGRVDRYVSIRFDISEQKADRETLLKREAELAQQKRILESVIESEFTGYWDWNIAANTQFYSPRWLAMLGYEPGDLPDTPETGHLLIHPDDRRMAFEHFQHHAQSHGECPFYNEIRYRHRNGSTVWMMCLGQVVEWATDGTPVRMVGSSIDITDRRHAERLLENRDKDMRMIFGAVPGVIYRCKCDGAWTMDWISDGIMDLVGYPPSHFVNNHVRTFASVIHPEDRDGVERAVFEAVAAQREYEIRYRVVHRSGDVRWVQERGGAVDDGTDQPLIGFIIDVTERKMIEDSLAQKEALLRGLFELAPIGIALSDLESGSYVDLNSALLAPTGFTREQLLQHDYSEICFPVAGDGLVQAQLESEGRFGPIEREVLRSDGSAYPVLLHGMVVRDTAGKRLLWSIVEDISRRKESERELKESHNRLQLALDATNTGLWEWNFSNNGTYYNDSWYTMLGYEVGELPMELDSWRAICHPDDLQRAYGEIERYLAGETPLYHCQQRLRRKDGGWMWINDVGKVVERDELGRPTRMIGVHIDIQAHKASEGALTAATEAALAASKAKSEFLANMSHEIRTPMNGVLGMLELLLETPQSDEQRDLANTAHQSAESLLAIINDILDFSKIEAGKIELRLKPFSLRGFLTELEKLHDIRAQQKGITLVANIPATIPDQLIGDETRLRQVLINLISNALKFTPEGGAIVLMVENDCESEDELKLLFHVTDTGIGIPAEAQHRIFESFEQADASTTREYGGTGLGLAISARLVALMGGEIGLRSQEGKGSVFYFSARFGRGVVGVAVPSESKRSQRAAPSGSLQRYKVLVAEDNAVNQKLVKRILENAGHEVVIANDGQQAVSLFGTMPFDVVLMDIQMPIMGGEEAAARIRASIGGSEVPIIAVTANAITGDRERYLQAGLDGYVAKPISSDELFTVIAELKAEKRSH